jgi:segregation and condensation protein B
MPHPLAAPVLRLDGPSRRPRDHRSPLAFRLPEPAESAPADPLARTAKIALLEAALMLSDEPLSPRKLGQVAGLADTRETRRLLARLQELYQLDGSSFHLEEVGGGFQLLTRPEFSPWLIRQRRPQTEYKLTPAMREALAIIAYRQPIVRADLEGIRGVQSGDVLRQLMEKGLIRIAGREESLGRPVLYGTSKKFLQMLGLRSLKDLPRAAELRRPAGSNKPEAEDEEE